jgi:predicted MFS family arabinose efflux permease
MGEIAATAGDASIDFGLAGKVVLLSGLTLSSYALFGLSPVLPAIAAHFSQTPNAGLLTRLLISAAGIMVAVASPIVGAIADRCGARRVLMLGLVVYALAGCAPFFLDNLYAILLSRMVMGLAIAAVGAVILAILVTHSTGAARNRWLGYLTTTATIVSVFYSPIVGYIGRFGWRWAFLTFLFALPLLILTIIGIERDPPRPRVEQSPKSAAGRAGFSLGTPPVFIVFVFAAGAVLVSPSVYIPFRLREIGITDSGSIGMLLIPSSIAGVVAGLSYGWIRSKLSMPLTFVIGFFAVAAGLLITATAHEAAQVMAGQVMTGFGTGINMPGIFVLASNAGSDAFRARTMGFAKTGVYGGPMLGQLLLEPVIARTNFAAVLSLLGLACAAFGVYYLRQVINGHRAPMQQT